MDHDLDNIYIILQDMTFSDFNQSEKIRVFNKNILESEHFNIVVHGSFFDGTSGKSNLNLIFRGMVFIKKANENKSLWMEQNIPYDNTKLVFMDLWKNIVGKKKEKIKAISGFFDGEINFEKDGKKIEISLAKSYGETIKHKESTRIKFNGFEAIETWNQEKKEGRFEIVISDYVSLIIKGESIDNIDILKELANKINLQLIQTKL
ncbi:MAG: hypothetical protein Q7O12_02385 [Deltaproteobacteria bacterium]|nr:hypothetical protein [Deltaproteobacteria bacterium]